VIVDVRSLPVGEDNEEIEVTLDQLARAGARRMIAAALEAEIEEYVASCIDERGEEGPGGGAQRPRRGAAGDRWVGYVADPRAAGQRQAC
jgi:hypothetical protein